MLLSMFRSTESQSPTCLTSPVASRTKTLGRDILHQTLAPCTPYITFVRNLANAYMRMHSFERNRGSGDSIRCTSYTMAGACHAGSLWLVQHRSSPRRRVCFFLNPLSESHDSGGRIRSQLRSTRQYIGSRNRPVVIRVIQRDEEEECSSVHPSTRQ